MTGECVLWWMSYHQPMYSVCEDEREAAGLAWGIADSGTGAVMGVQFPDGTLVKRQDWPLLEQVTRDYEAAPASVQPPRPHRRARDPFQGQPVEVDATDPAWVGVPWQEWKP